MYTVICGPDLTDQTVSEFVNNEFNKNVNDNELFIFFPEKNHGAAGVSNQVRETVVAYSSAVFVTRYSDVLSELADMVAHGKLPIEKFLVKLVRYDEHRSMYITEHRMDSTGQYLVDWPYGVFDR